jgi:hypothetical protein
MKSSSKQVFKQSKVFALAIAMAMVGCKGEDGEIGPKGDTGATGAAGVAGATGASFDKVFENGFIKGTIKGVRNDGTAFEEPFEYKMSTDQTTFEKLSPTEHRLSLWRSKSIAEDNNYLHIDLIVTNKDQTNATGRIDDAALRFSKVLADRNLFVIFAGPNFKPVNITFPISRANNATYKLVKNGLNQEYYRDDVTGESFRAVKDADGNTIFFSNSFVYDAATNSHYSIFKHIINSAGIKSTTSTLWGNVRMVHTERSFEIFRTSAGTDLSETVSVPADTQEITNFAYNTITGLVTFDYKLNIHELREFDRNYYHGIYPRNTTMNALEIRGSASVTVYNALVMRKSAERK